MVLSVFAAMTHEVASFDIEAVHIKLLLAKFQQDLSSTLEKVVMDILSQNRSVKKLNRSDRHHFVRFHTEHGAALHSSL